MVLTAPQHSKQNTKKGNYNIIIYKSLVYMKDLKLKDHYDYNEKSKHKQSRDAKLLN